ncbi:MAG: sensor histidine kinase [Bacteroidetes bacterium]|nr:MAG: sensor histidine kinase [Bacteroidota bacterium]
MKKNVIIFVIVVITISLVGLIGIQLYWISNALAVKETNFNRGVSEAITTAVYKYNKLEMANAIVRKQEQDRQVNRFFSALDSINREYYRDVLKAVNSENHAIDDLLSGWQGDPFSPHSDIYGRGTPQHYDTVYNHHEQRNSRQKGYATNQRLAGNYDPFLEFFQRTQIVNEIFDDLFSNNFLLSSSSEASRMTLDSLIKTELEMKGIKIPFEFGIYDYNKNILLAERTGGYTRELMESNYIYSLYPNVLFANPEFLLLHFPNQKTYLLTQMNIMSAISTIFILVIISSFTYTIITIFRQKKLSLIKNDFINNMTHELKTPISTISLACQALRDKDVQKSETLYQNYINVINEENERLGMMAEKVLQTAQLEKGKLRLNKIGFNLHDVIEDAIKKIDLQLKSRHGKISTQLAAEFSFVEADKVHLVNVIFNLLDNAIKYSHESPEIKISTENVNKGILIHVSDKGMGISKVNQSKVFDTLYRISTGNVHNVKGFGLGLSYVKTIVELHGGHINLESEIRKGSTFSVFIPFGFE